MSDNIKILKNYLLYFLLMILLCMVGVSGVCAETLTGMKFANRNYNQFPFSTDYEPYTYNADYFTFRGTEGTPNYMILNVCGTGLLDFNISNSSGQFKYLGYVEQANKSCTTQGYSGYEYIYYFNFVKFDDAGGGDFGVSFNNTITNAYGYNTYVTFKSITFSNTSNLDVLKQQQDIINQNSQNTQNIINNQNTNNENLIDSNLQNTQEIINNQNENTQSLIEDNKNNFQTCTTNLFDKNNYQLVTAYIGNSSSIWRYDSTNRSIRIPVNPNTTYTISANNPNEAVFKAGYTTSLNLPTSGTDITLYDVVRYNNTNTPITITTGSNAKYIVIQFGTNQFYTSINTLVVSDGTETCVNKLDEQTNAINGLNDSLNDDDSSGATSEASEFFSSFTTNTFGLTSIITAPLNLIQSLTSSTCTELHLPLPYLNNKYLDLPCMTSIYQTHFGTFFTMYQTITYGIIAYWVIVRIFNQVKDFKNPEHDEIEVVDL